MEEAKERIPLEDKCSGNEEPKKEKRSNRCKKVEMLHKTKSNEKRKKSSKNFKPFKTFRYFKPFRQFKNSKSLKKAKNCKTHKKKEKERAKKRAKRKAKKNAPKDLLPVGLDTPTTLPNEGNLTLENVAKLPSNQRTPTEMSASSRNSRKIEQKNNSSNAGYVALAEDNFSPNHSDDQKSGRAKNYYEIKHSVDEDHKFPVHTYVETEKTPPVEVQVGDNLDCVVEENSPKKKTQLGITIENCQKNACKEEHWTTLKPHLDDPQRDYCGGEEEITQVKGRETSRQNNPKELLQYDMHRGEHEVGAPHNLIDILGEKKTSRIQFRELMISMNYDTKNIITVMEKLSEEKLLYLTIPFNENYDIVKYFNFLPLEKIEKMINLLHIDNYKNFILSFSQKKIIEIVNYVSVNTSINILLNLSNNKVAYILNHIEEKIFINLLNGIPLCKFYHIAEYLPMQKISLFSNSITYEKLYVMHNSLPSKKLHQLANNLPVQILNKLINELPLYKSVKVLKMLPPCKIAESINVKELTPHFASEIGRSFNAPEIIEIVNYLNEGNADILLSRCNLTKIILYINYISMEDFKSLIPKLPTQFLTQIVNDISLKLLVELFLSLQEEKAIPCLYALTERKLNFALRVIPMQRVIIDTVLRQGGTVLPGYHQTEAIMGATTTIGTTDVTPTCYAHTGADHPHRHLINMIYEHNLALLLNQLNADEYAPFCNLMCADKVEEMANSLRVDCRTAAALILHLPLTKMVEVLQRVREKRREEMTKYMPTFISQMVLHKSSNTKGISKIEQMFITCKLLRLRKIFRNSKKIPTLKKNKRKLKCYHLRKKTNDIIRTINVKNYSMFLNFISCAKIVEMYQVIDDIMCRHPYTEPKVMDCLFFFFNFFGKIRASKWKTEEGILRCINKDNSKNREKLHNAENSQNGEPPHDTYKQTKLCPLHGSTKTEQLSPSPSIKKMNPSTDNTTIREITTHEIHTNKRETKHLVVKTGKCNSKTDSVRSSFYTFLVHFVCFIKMHIENYVLQNWENLHNGEGEEEPTPNRPQRSFPLKGAFPPNHEQGSSAPLDEDSSMIEPHPHSRKASRILITTKSKLIFNSVRKIMKNIFFSIRKINQIGNPSLVLKHISMFNIIRADIVKGKSERQKEDLKNSSGWDYSKGTPIKSTNIKDGKTTIIKVKNTADFLTHSGNFLNEKYPLVKNILNEMKKKNCTNGTVDGEKTNEAMTIEDVVKKDESNYMGMSQNGITTCALKEGESPMLRNSRTNGRGIIGSAFSVNKRETWKYNLLVNDEGDNHIEERNDRKKDTYEHRALIKKSKKNYFKKLKNISQMTSFKRFTRSDKHHSNMPRKDTPTNLSINAPMETCQIDRQSRNTTVNPRINEKVFFPTPNSQTEEVPSDVSSKGKKNKLSLLKFIFALNDSNDEKYANNITLIINFFFLKKKIFLSKCKNQIVGSSLNVLINDNGCKRLLNFNAPPNDTSCYINSNIVSVQYDDTDAIKNLYSLTSSKSIPMCTTPGIIPSIDMRTDFSTIPQKGKTKKPFKSKILSTKMNKENNNMSIKNMCNDLNSSIILFWKSSQFGYILLDAHNSLHINIHDPSTQFSLNLFRQHDDVSVGGGAYRKGSIFFSKNGKKKVSFKKIKSMFSRILEKKSDPVAITSSGAIVKTGQCGAGGYMEGRQNGDDFLDRTVLLPSGKNNLSEGKGGAPGDVSSRGDNFVHANDPKPEEHLISDDNEVYFGDEYYKCYEGEVSSVLANEVSIRNGESASVSGPFERPSKSGKNGEVATHLEGATNMRTPKREHEHHAEKSENEKIGENEKDASNEHNRKNSLKNKHSIVINKFSNIINEAQRILSIKEKMINQKILEQIHPSYISPSSLTESEKEKMREIKNNELNKIMEEELRKVNKNFQSKDTYSFGNTSYTDDEFNIILYLEKKKKKKDQKGAKRKKQLMPLKRKEKYFIPFRFNRSKILKLKLLTLIENALCSYDVNVGEGTFISELNQQGQGETTKEYVDSSSENLNNVFPFPLEEHIPSNSSHNVAEQSIFSFLNSNASQQKTNLDIIPLNDEPNEFPKNRLTLSNQVGDINLFDLHDDMCNNDPPLEINMNTEKNESSTLNTNSNILQNGMNRKGEQDLQNELLHNDVDIVPFEPSHSSSSTRLADKYLTNECSSIHLRNYSHNKINTHTNRICESSYENLKSVPIHERNNSTKGSSSSESNGRLNDDTDVNKMSTYENVLQMFNQSIHHLENGNVEKDTAAADKGKDEWGNCPEEVLLTHSRLFYRHGYNNLEKHSKERDSGNHMNKLDQVDRASPMLEKGEGNTSSKIVEDAKRCNYSTPHIVDHCKESEDLHLELSPLEKCVNRHDMYMNVEQNRVNQNEESHLTEKREHFLNGLLSQIHNERNGDDHLGGDFDGNLAANPHNMFSVGAEKVGLLNLHCLFEKKSENFCLISEGCAKASNYVNDSMLIHTKLYNEIFHIKKDDMSTPEKCSMLGMSIAPNWNNSFNSFNSYNSDKRHKDSTEKQIMCIHKKKKILCNICGNVLKKNILKDMFFFRISIINKKYFLSKRAKIKIYYQSPLIRANFVSKDNVTYSLEKNMTEYKLRIIAINKKKMRKKLSLSKSKFFRKCLEIELISSLDNMLISQVEEKKEVITYQRDDSSVQSSMDHFNTYKHQGLRDKIETRKNLSYEQIKNYSKRLSSMNQSSNDVPPAIYNSHFAILNFSILDDKNKKYNFFFFLSPRCA
eukprot:XP_002262026.1 hypothetical protein, conserved in Plasmodium species [Plasmodium knowlesi strain H]